MSDRVNNEELKRLALKEEQRFLSIILKDKEKLMDCVAYGIKSGPKGHFWHSEPRFLYELIHSYYLKHNSMLTRTAIDSIMDATQEIGKRKLTDEDRTSARMYWDKVYHLESDVEDYTLLREHLNDRYVQWQAVEILTENLSNLVKSTDNQGVIVKEIRERFQTIDNLEADPYSLTMGIEEGIVKAMEYVDNRKNNPDSLPTILTGLKAVDEIYHGFEYGTYTIISGMVNGGKTTFMFNIGFNMARAGYNVVYVSLEKKAIPLFTRLLALHALVDYNCIKVGGVGEKGLNEENYSRLKDASNDLLKKIKPNFDIIQMAQKTKVSKILSEVELIKKRKKIDVLIIDYLGVVGNETSHAARPDLDDAITSSRIQAFGRINNFVTITGVQMKTASQKEIRGKSKKVTESGDGDVAVHTEDLAGSKMIIADADNGLSVVLNNDSPPTKMFVFGTKARDDESRRTMVLDFDGKLGRVSDPIFQPGQVKDVDDILFNSDLSEDDLADENIIFGNLDTLVEEVKPEEVKRSAKRDSVLDGLFDD